MSGIDTVLSRLRLAYPESSGRRIRKWLVQGRVRVNGRVVRDGRTLVGTDDVISLSPHPEPLFPAPLRLIHEDDDLLVLDKPAGLLTIATERERHRTAYRLLWDYLAAHRPPRRPFIVHRLDRETSGLVVVAKSAAVKRALQAQFAVRRVERVYVAVVEGVLRPERGTLESSLVEDRGLRVRPLRGRTTQAGSSVRRAITHYRVLERWRNATVVELALGTGRRRQIRVQLADLGHPIVGDLDHGSRHNPVGRLCLHATRLGFRHPATRKLVRFQSPPPGAFASVGRHAGRS